MALPFVIKLNYFEGGTNSAQEPRMGLHPFGMRMNCGGVRPIKLIRDHPDPEWVTPRLSGVGVT